ncbi:MAG: YraN family protein [Bacteroidetes bacterium]|nr:YraN family protein [Bacteroidota bacterium]MDA0899060.1 YraN family protein [Bacteroidota bacterium]
MKTYKTYERKAADLLKKMGHTLHYQNYRSGRSQIDLITQLESCLYIVEVKYRSSTVTDYENWVSERQCQRLLQAGVRLVGPFQCNEIKLLLIAYQGNGSKAEIIPLAVN